MRWSAEKVRLSFFTLRARISEATYNETKITILSREVTNLFFRLHFRAFPLLDGSVLRLSQAEHSFSHLRKQRLGLVPKIAYFLARRFGYLHSSMRHESRCKTSNRSVTSSPGWNDTTCALATLYPPSGG